MANAIIAQSITRRNVEQAYRKMLDEAQPQHQDKILRAYALLSGKPWQFDGDVLRMTNSDSTKRYTVTDTMCECKGYEHNYNCYHREAYRLLIAASKYSQPQSHRCICGNATYRDDHMCKTCIEGGFMQDAIPQTSVAELPTDNAALAALEAYEAEYIPQCMTCTRSLTASDTNICSWCIAHRDIEELFS